MASDHSRTQALFHRLQRISRPSSSVKPEAVHQLRTTIRRLETLLATTSAAPGRKERKLLKDLARLRRRAGKVRDLDVQIEALSSLRLESSARARAKLMAFLEKARARREKKLLAALESEADDGLQQRLKLVFARLQQESPKPAAGAEKRFLAAALAKFAAVVKERLPLSEANLHNFRMECKRVRYLAEMAGEGPAVAAVTEPLKRIQDAIGVWHDWLTLTATAESVLSHEGQVPLLSALRANVRSRYLEALRITADAKRALLAKQETELRRPTSSADQVAAGPQAMAATA
jgi:CHAD domain-containing protein